ncbi:MAG: hypothetical protein HYT70_04655 [Candidatus Aenigmarchaeota archaeon]|nr:hypothetical protein [Candidatus Aenigmarchaeota archaeon]
MAKVLSWKETKLEKCYECGKVLHPKKQVHLHKRLFCCAKCAEHYKKHKGKKKKAEVCEFC